MAPSITLSLAINQLSSLSLTLCLSIAFSRSLSLAQNTHIDPGKRRPLLSKHTLCVAVAVCVSALNDGPPRWMTVCCVFPP